MDLCSSRHESGFSAECLPFARSCCTFPWDGIGEELKRHAAKWYLQRSLNNQILDHKAILDLCENKIISINFLEFVKKVWSVLKILRLINDMKVGTLYLSHGLVTNYFHCHPCELVLSEQLKISLCDLCIQLVLVRLHG